MKRYQIKETLIMGYINVPDDVTEAEIFDYMDQRNCWPDDEEVDSHEVLQCPDEDVPSGIKHIIKFIVKSKQDDEAARVLGRAKLLQRKKILGIKAAREDADLMNKSSEELQAMLDALDE